MKIRGAIILSFILIVFILVISSPKIPIFTSPQIKPGPEACALSLYNDAKMQGMEFNSQCLGTCSNYAVDIVHVPRTIEDEKPENQCTALRQGKLRHFIELDKNGNIVRIK